MLQKDLLALITLSSQQRENVLQNGLRLEDISFMMTLDLQPSTKAIFTQGKI